MKYFNIRPNTTLEDLQKQYRSWSKQLHPDAGGAVADFQTLTKEYRLAREQIQNQPAPSSQSYTTDPADELISELSKKLFAKIVKGICVEIRNALR
jgi:hypothetical protein